MTPLSKTTPCTWAYLAWSTLPTYGSWAIRKAKEFLLTGQPITAEEAQAAGMVNQVVARDELEEATLVFARTLSDKPSFALKLGKDAINAAFHAQGFENVQRSAFNAHHLAHTHYRLHQDGSFIDKEFMRNFQSKKKPG